MNLSFVFDDGCTRLQVWLLDCMQAVPKIVMIIVPIPSLFLQVDSCWCDSILLILQRQKPIPRA